MRVRYLEDQTLRWCMHDETRKCTINVVMIMTTFFKVASTPFRCKGTGKPIICPDGDEVDWNGPEVMEELAGCRMEEW